MNSKLYFAWDGKVPKIALYYTYVLDYHQSDDEADIYTLETWQICTPDDGTYEADVKLTTV